jgi:acetoin utilization deacetylase AcuC-like enzyme
MQTIHTDRHRLHHGQAELIDGMLKPCFEMPSRVDMILERVRAVGLGLVVPPARFGAEPLARVHTPGYLRFLENAWADWSALGRTHDALPLVWPVRDLRTDVEPEHIDGRMGFYSMDAGVPITAGTWEAVRASADVALTGAQALREGERAAFALCRPPGHHAAAGYMGGYCYLNNAAIAARWLRDAGAARVAVLDVDYHHGNGTQSIFYRDPDVLFASLHADPRVEYPYFAGFADERGEGAGLGFNHNYPLPHGTAWPGYGAALEEACARIREHAPDTVVVSLGVDTFEQDPISAFRLVNDDYLRIGETIARLGRPTLFVMEGGYAVEDIGVNAVNVLVGFEGRRG